MAELAKAAGATDSGAKEKSDRDARWVADWSDDLAVAIALREFERAVTLVEEGTELSPPHSSAANHNMNCLL
jgi:exocyst complex component 8